MTSSLSVYSRLVSVKKQSERAYLRSSLGTLIYLGTFSLLAVTHLDTWLASSCTRAIIWSLLDLGATSDSPLAKLLMHDTTQCIVVLERDLYWDWRVRVPSYTPSLWSRRPPSWSAPPVSPCMLKQAVSPDLILWPAGKCLSAFISGDL